MIDSASQPSYTVNMKQRQENGLLNILVNIVIPALVLVRFSGEDWLGPVYGLIIALLFPLAYGFYDFVVRRERNMLSILGVVSILLTGGIGLLQLDPKWIAVKEAGVPLLIASVLFFSMKTKVPLVETLIAQVIDLKRIREAAKDADHLQRQLNITSYVVIASFLVSTVLNYIVARLIVVSEPGTSAFTEELGRLTAVSYPFIALPSTLVMLGGIVWLVVSIRKTTNLTLEELVHDRGKPADKAKL